MRCDDDDRTTTMNLYAALSLRRVWRTHALQHHPTTHTVANWLSPDGATLQQQMSSSRNGGAMYNENELNELEWCPVWCEHQVRVSA